MTTPASGTISLFNVNQEIGNGTNQISLDWVRGNTKDGQNSLGGIYSRAWYQKNNAGNCNNGHCNCWGNCGDINCYQCFASQCINCVNCDGRPWLQPNCNCACTYNCNANLASINCNCNCQCDCGGCCFLEGSIVIMADGSHKRIEDVRVGEYLMGAYGEANPILALNRPLLGNRIMARINGVHVTTLDHAHLLPDGKFGAVSLDEYLNGENGQIQEVILADGRREWWILPGFRDEDLGNIKQMGVGDVVWSVDGEREISSITDEILPPETQLYNFVVGGTHVYFVDGFCVTGFHNAHDFDHQKWRYTEEPWGPRKYFRSATNPYCKKRAA